MNSKSIIVDLGDGEGSPCQSPAECMESIEGETGSQKCFITMKRLFSIAAV